MLDIRVFPLLGTRGGILPKKNGTCVPQVQPCQPPQGLFFSLGGPTIKSSGTAAFLTQTKDEPVWGKVSVVQWGMQVSEPFGDGWLLLASGGDFV